MPAKKKACKPTKGKRFAKRVNGKCRSFGQKGKAKGAGTEFVLALKRVMPTVPGPQVLRSVRNHPVLMLYPVRSGNAVVRNQCDEKES